MKIIKEISTAEFEAEFLRAEFFKPTFRHIQKRCNAIVNRAKDYSDENHNDLRSLLLQIERGGFLARLPVAMRWYSAEITIYDLLKSRVINEGSWHNVFGNKRQVNEISAAIKDGVNDNNHVRKISEISSAMAWDDGEGKMVWGKKYKETMKAKLIFLKNKKDELTILEGNHRAVSLSLLYHECNISHLFPMKVIVGDIGNRKCTWF